MIMDIYEGSLFSRNDENHEKQNENKALKSFSSDPCMVYSNDSSLFFELNKRINCDRLAKVQYSRRTWRNVADELRKKQRFIYIPNLHEGGITMKQELTLGKWGLILSLLLMTVIFFLLSYVGNLSLVSALAFSLVMLMFLGMGVWEVCRLRAYVEAYLRAWWFQKDCPRPPIEAIEMIDLLVDQLSFVDYDRQNFSNAWFGSLINLETFIEHYERLQDYKRMLERNSPDLECAQKASRKEGGYVGPKSANSRRLSEARKCLGIVDEKISDAGSTAKELVDELQPNHKEETKKAMSVRQRTSKYHEDNDEIVSGTEKELTESQQKIIIDKLDFILRSFSKALEAIDGYLMDHKQLNKDGELQPTGYSSSSS